MQTSSHLILGWCVGEAAGLSTPRLRRIVALAGVAPDLDTVPYLAAYVWFGFDRQLAFTRIHQVHHHRYTHGVGFLVLVAVLCGLYILWRGPGRADVPTSRPPARRRAALGVGVLAGAAVLVHLFCDLIGSGYDWPLYPYWPVSDAARALSWSWELDAWPNRLLLWGLLAGSFVYARYAGHSFVESFHYRLDRRIVRILQTGSDRTGDDT
ncbi:MAG: metal-dependent hydrolase [Planctomycetota bacterium]